LVERQQQTVSAGERDKNKEKLQKKSTAQNQYFFQVFI